MLNDREKIISNWYIVMHSIIMGSILTGINSDAIFRIGQKEMDNYRISNCPSISSREMREIHDDLLKLLNNYKKILEFNKKNFDTFGV